MSKKRHSSKSARASKRSVQERIRMRRASARRSQWIMRKAAAGDSLIGKSSKEPMVQCEDETNPLEPSGEQIDIKPRLVAPKPVAVEEVLAQPELRTIARLEKTSKAKEQRKKVEQAKLVQREAELEGGQKKEAEWDDKQSEPITWLAVAGAAAIIIVVGVVVIKNLQSEPNPTPSTVVVPPAPVPQKPFEDSPEQWFQENTGVSQKSAFSVLENYMAAKTPEEKSTWVRNPEQFLSRVATHPVKVQVKLASPAHRSWSVGHSDDTGYLILDTINKEFLPCRAYFTRHGGKIKLDWAATTAYSEMALPALRKHLIDLTKSPNAAKVTDELLLRCRITRRDEFYAGPYNDKVHAAFLLSSDDLSEYLWGYVTRNSKLDLALRDILDHGRFAVSLKKNIRVTLRVKRSQKDALPSQIEVLELLHRDWVTP